MEFLAQHAVEALNSEAKRRRLESSPLGSVSAPQELPRDPVSLATFNGGYSQPNDDNSSDRGGRTDPPEEDGDDEEAMNGLKTKKRKQKSMYKGVFKCGKKFKAQIQTHGVQHYLGLYDTEEEAARAYDNHARFVLGAKAKTNFPYDSRDISTQSFIPAMGINVPPRSAPTSLITPSITPSNPNNPAVPPALVGSSTAGSSAGEEEDENGMNRQPLKRSYVGMKVRKKNQKELMEANKKTMMSIPPPINFMPHFSGVPAGDLTGQAGANNKLLAPSQATFGHTLIHLPMPLVQSQFLMNSLPNGYTPVLHPMRYASGFPPTIDGRLPSVPSLTSSLSNNFANGSSATTTSNASTIHDLAAVAAGALPPAPTSIPQSIHNYAAHRDSQPTSQQFHDQRASNASLPASLSNREAPRIDWSKHALEITGAYPYTAVPLTQSEPDWREQIYYWTGKLAFDDSKSCLSWKGHWLGSFTGKPSREEFASSSNEFSYYSQRIERSRAFTNEGLLRPHSGAYKGSYNMDNDGTGEMEQYNDKEFFIEFEEILGLSTPRYHVYGKGDSEFGVFILHGSYDAITRVLEMDRQYLAENDLRKTMSLMQLKLHFKRQLA